MNETERGLHWDAAYADGDRSRSWYQVHADTALRLLRAARSTPSDSVIDVGGGAATLVDDLLDAGYRDVTVLDVSAAAISIAQERLGSRAAQVSWLVADLLNWTPGRTYDVWHDRAVLHFLTSAQDRESYRGSLLAATHPGSRVLIGAFGPAGPEQCSGLPVIRFTPTTLKDFLGTSFTVIASSLEQHTTPAGSKQQFVWCTAIRL